MIFIKLLVSVLVFFFISKIFFYYLWFWQLKEYHTKRAKAHFETYPIKKIIAGYIKIRRPKFTKKIITISLFGLILSIVLSFISSAHIYIIFLIFFSPILFSLFILLFQIPTEIIKNFYIKKAKKKRENIDVVTIGITGSYGKTAVKEFLADMLSQKYRILKTPIHTNSEIGISKLVLNNLDSSYDFFVCEVGAYERGKIRQVSSIVKPKIGILTGINEQHESTFGSYNNIKKGKYEMIENSEVGFFNGENKIVKELFDKTEKQKYLVNQKSRFYVYVDHLPKWDRENILLASEVASYLGVEDETIIDNISKIKSTLDIKKGYRGINILNSTYSANPDSTISHLEYLNNKPGKKIVVMTHLIELGKSSSRVHKKIGEKIKEVCDLGIVITTDRLKSLKEGGGDKILYLDNIEDIMKVIDERLEEGDYVLLESRIFPNLIKKLYESNI